MYEIDSGSNGSIVDVVVKMLGSLHNTSKCIFLLVESATALDLM